MLFVKQQWVAAGLMLAATDPSAWSHRAGGNSQPGGTTVDSLGDDCGRRAVVVPHMLVVTALPGHAVESVPRRCT